MKWKCEECEENCELVFSEREGTYGTTEKCPIYHKPANWKETKEDEPTKTLKATDSFPKNMAEILRDAPIEYEEFRNEFSKFYNNVGFDSPLESLILFRRLSKESALIILKKDFHEKALDYALKKGWVKWEKPKKVIDVKASERVFYYTRSGSRYLISDSGYASQIEIE